MSGSLQHVTACDSTLCEFICNFGQKISSQMILNLNILHFLKQNEEVEERLTLEKLKLFLNEKNKTTSANRQT